MNMSLTYDWQPAMNETAQSSFAQKAHQEHQLACSTWICQRPSQEYPTRIAASSQAICRMDVILILDPAAACAHGEMKDDGAVSCDRPALKHMTRLKGSTDMPCWRICMPPKLFCLHAVLWPEHPCILNHNTSLRLHHACQCVLGRADLQV